MKLDLINNNIFEKPSEPGLIIHKNIFEKKLFRIFELKINEGGTTNDGSCITYIS